MKLYIALYIHMTGLQVKQLIFENENPTVIRIMEICFSSYIFVLYPKNDIVAILWTLVQYPLRTC